MNINVGQALNNATSFAGAYLQHTAMNKAQNAANKLTDKVNSKIGNVTDKVNKLNSIAGKLSDGLASVQDKINLYSSPIFDPAESLNNLSSKLISEHLNKDLIRGKLDSVKDNLLGQAQAKANDALSNYTTGLCNRMSDSAILATSSGMLQEITPGNIQSVIGGVASDMVGNLVNQINPNAITNAMGQLAGIKDMFSGGLELNIDLGGMIDQGKSMLINAGLNMLPNVPVGEIVALGQTALSVLKGGGNGFDIGLDKMLSLDVTGVIHEMTSNIIGDLNTNLLVGLSGGLSGMGDQLMGSLGDMGNQLMGGIDGLTGQLSGGLNGLASQLNGGLDVDSTMASLGVVSEKGLSAIGDMFSSSMESVTGAFNKLTSEGVAGISDTLGGGLSSITDNISGMSGIDLKSMATDVASMVTTGDIGILKDASGKLVETTANKFVDSISSTLAASVDSIKGGTLDIAINAATSFNDFITEAKTTPDIVKHAGGEIAEHISAAVSIPSITNGILENVTDKICENGNTGGLVTAIAEFPTLPVRICNGVKKCAGNCKQTPSSVKNILVAAKATDTELNTVTDTKIKLPTTVTNVIDEIDKTKTDISNVVDNVYNLVEFKTITKHGEILADSLLGTEIVKKCKALISPKQALTEDLYDGYNSNYDSIGAIA